MAKMTKFKDTVAAIVISSHRAERGEVVVLFGSTFGFSAGASTKLNSKKFAGLQQGTIITFDITISLKTGTRYVYEDTIQEFKFGDSPAWSHATALKFQTLVLPALVRDLLNEDVRLRHQFSKTFIEARNFTAMYGTRIPFEQFYESLNAEAGWLDMRKDVAERLWNMTSSKDSASGIAGIYRGLSTEKLRYGWLPRKVLEEFNEGLEEAKLAHSILDDRPRDEVPVNVDKDDHGYETVGDVYALREDMNVFRALVRLSEAGEVTNAMAVGASGYGKTSLPMAIAEATKMKCVRVNCSAVRDPVEWFGYREARDGDTVFERTEMAEAIEEGNAIIILDEFNRVEPWVANSMLQIMDLNGSTTIHGERITRGDNVIFFATINAGSKFTGTFALDAALMNRINVIFKVGPLHPEIEARLLVERSGISEAAADKIVRIITKLRELVDYHDEDVDVSTRSSLKVANLHSAGLDLVTAFKYAIVNAVDPESPIVKDIIDTINR